MIDIQRHERPVPCDETMSGPGFGPASDPASSIDAWLDVLVRLLHGPEARSTAVRDELSDFLHDRVRDLMVSGMNEQNAVRNAIGELGEVADLARRLNKANRPQIRSWLMSMLWIGVGATAVLTGVMAITPGTPTVPSQQFEALEVTTQVPDDIANTRIDISEVSLGEYMEYLQSMLDRPVLAHWDGLGGVGIDSDTPISLTLRDMKLERGLDIVADHLSDQSNPLAWRFSDDLIEFGPAREFDYRELVLISYDIEATVKDVMRKHHLTFDESAERIEELMRSMVCERSWDTAGGDLARSQFVNGRLFVHAPARLHDKIRWILAELSAGSLEARSPGIGQALGTSGNRSAGGLSGRGGRGDLSDLGGGGSRGGGGMSVSGGRAGSTGPRTGGR